jgi:dihydrofolate reductase
VGRLVYSAIASLDGFVVDADGDFGWAAPDDEVHAFVNDQEREVGTYLYGRRMYDVMRFWETAGLDEPLDEVADDYAQVWRAADKVVFSRALDSVDTARTRLEHDFDPRAVRTLVGAADRDVSIGGPTLAAAALGAGIVDDVHLFLHPVVVGGGTAALPTSTRFGLRLVDTHTFRSGVVHLHHRVDKS